MTLLLYPKFKGFDGNGEPLIGGLLETYQAGTDTPKITYSDPDLLIPNEPVIELDGNGEADIYLADGLYKLVLKDSDGALIWTMDNVDGIGQGIYKYEHTQSAEALEWEVGHNLNSSAIPAVHPFEKIETRSPISCGDGTYCGETYCGGSIDYTTYRPLDLAEVRVIDVNNLKIIFNEAVDGVATIML